MRISKALNDAVNAQIGRELHAFHQYLCMAAYFEDRALKKLAQMFYEQAEEEKEHALKFVKYVTSVDGKVAIPALDAPRSDFGSVEEAVRQARDWEVEITGHINALMDQAIAERDHAARGFLQWFVTEQVEEIQTMDNLLKVVHGVGERNVFMVEAYLVHGE